MKKKGFTLIELLAVIIILAVIALIATPVVLNIIEKMRISAAESSAKGYTKAVEYQIINDGMFDGVSYDGEYDVTDNDLDVVYQGEGPSQGSFIIEKNKVTYGEFCINGYPIKYENDIGKYTPNLLDCGNGNTNEPTFTPPEGVIASELCEGTSYDDVTNINIEKAEDLACISYLINTQSKTFYGKTLSLIADINLNDDNSYRDKSNKQIYKDMNGNGVEEDIKTEFTTSKGFKPIGTDALSFFGTFEGYGFTISNLYINRPTESEIGLFGCIYDGSVKGINIDSANVTGNEKVGGIVGNLKKGTISEATVHNSKITGKSNGVGGITGYSANSNNSVTSVIVNADLNGYGNVGGIIGIVQYSLKVNIRGIFETGSITKSNTSNNVTGKIIGYGSFNGVGYYSNMTTSNDKPSSNFDGKSYELNKHVIGLYDDVLDTIIGGDNDNSGYYFDYENEESTKIVVKSVETEPIKIKLKGEGTEEAPYLISNVKDWREATTKVNGGYYFKLTNDLDFENEKFYMLGTISNYFDGVLDGNNKTIKNVNASGYCSGVVGYLINGTVMNFNIKDSSSKAATDHAGMMVGYNNGGTIKGINLNNINVSGTNNIGGLVGSNDNNGIIIGINIDNIEVNGNEKVGGLVGELKKGSINEVAIHNAKITGSSTGVGGIAGYSTNTNNSVTSVIVTADLKGYSNIGGIIGIVQYSSTANIRGIYETGSITKTNTSNNVSGKIIGYGSFSGVGYSSDKIISNDKASSNFDGKGYELNKHVMGLYDDVLDTYINGDNDSSGYYLDYENEESTKIVVKSTKLEPFKFNLQGEGTESNPYIITNASDWKNVSLKLKGGYYFKLNNDLDFENEKFYMIGTISNYFDGVLDGNNKTIKNVNTSGYCSGVVGYLINGAVMNFNIKDSTSKAATDHAGMMVGYLNGGTIKGVNLNNIEVTGNDKIGGLVGATTNNSKIIGINVDGIKVTGKMYTGGLVGELKQTTVNEVALHNGNVIQIDSDYVGGLVGMNRAKNNITSVILNVNVTGIGATGGIIGWNADQPHLKAVIENGTIATTSSRIGKISGYGAYSGIQYASNLVTLSAAGTYNGTGYTLALPTTVIESDNTEIDSLSYYDSKGLLDTVIGGDNDLSGYYLDYNSSGDKIIVVPVGGSSGSTNPDNPSNPTIEIDHNYTMTSIVGTTDTEAPTCELYYVVPVSNGIKASFSCTDNSGAPIVRSLFDSTTEKSAATFDTIGTLKNGSVSGNKKTVISTWNVNNPVSIPTPGTCYYFRYGAQDAEGNFSTYVTNICYTGFSN